MDVVVHWCMYWDEGALSVHCGVAADLEPGQDGETMQAVFHEGVVEVVEKQKLAVAT